MTSLADLADRAELTQLVSRLGHWLDAANFEDSAQIYEDGARIYTDDVIVNSPRGIRNGLAEVLQYVRDSNVERTQHFASDVLVDLAGEQLVQLRG
ncbi:MAG: nuclear transport factor 2 family protein, partial [Kibdelosporangium sp.]